MAENVIYTAGDKKAIDDLMPDFAKGQGLVIQAHGAAFLMRLNSNKNSLGRLNKREGLL